MFRQRPAERFFALAKAQGVAVIARVPLASGLLSGKFTAQTKFADDDHRQFNRNGDAFDVGETFSGVPYEVGLRAVERVRQVLDADANMAQAALRWILMFDAVSVVIPGARNPQQAAANAAASSLPALSESTMAQLKAVYDEDIRPHVHHRW
jgi:aryl-alcohol dehydrogenase-like predicted oxidoreductase